MGIAGWPFGHEMDNGMAVASLLPLQCDLTVKASWDLLGWDVNSTTDAIIARRHVSGLTQSSDRPELTGAAVECFASLGHVELRLR